MSNSTSASAAAGARLHGFDALRAVALLAGVALHGALPYLPGAGNFWLVSDTPSDALSLLFYVIHCWRMPLFFLIAGFFAQASLQRLGTAAFVRDRMRRIALPLLLFWPIVMTGIVSAIVLAVAVKNGGALPSESPPGPRFTPDDFPLTHLWFLYVLMLLYAAALAVRGALRRIDPHDHAGAGLRRVLDALLRPGIAALLGLPLAAALWLHSGWMPWFGVPTPDQSLYPNLPACIGFGVAFAVGWQLRRMPGLLDRFAHDWPWHLLAGAMALAYCLLHGSIAPAFSTVTRDPAWAGYAFAYSAAGWCFTLALTGLALRSFAQASTRWRYLADASYWIYLLHLPVLMALQVAAASLAWSWWIEYPLQLAACLALLLATYRLFVRHGRLGALLNGRRVPRAPAPNAAQGAL
jgi:glucans biosynthesis protein C